MKTTSNALLLFLLLITREGHTQVDPQLIRKNKKDFSNLNHIRHVYLAVKDVSSPIAQKYFDVLKYSWHLPSTVEMISENEIDAKKSRDALFITSYKATIAGTRNNDLAYLGYQCWSFTETALKDPESLFTQKRGKQILDKAAAFDQYDIEYLEIPKDTLLDFRKRASQDYSIFEMNENAFCNWGEGVFKNRIEVFQQFITTYAAGEQSDAIYDNMMLHSDSRELSKLQRQTLYIPDYLLRRENALAPGTYKPRSEESLMKPYTYKYKIASSAEINAKIINSETPVYYVYVKRYGALLFMMEVINSRTGEMIYNQYFTSEFFEPSMLKKLNAIMNG